MTGVQTCALPILNFSSEDKRNLAGLQADTAAQLEDVVAQATRQARVNALAGVGGAQVKDLVSNINGALDRIPALLKPATATAISTAQKLSMTRRFNYPAPRMPHRSLSSKMPRFYVTANMPRRPPLAGRCLFTSRATPVVFRDDTCHQTIP